MFEITRHTSLPARLTQGTEGGGPQRLAIFLLTVLTLTPALASVGAISVGALLPGEVAWVRAASALLAWGPLVVALWGVSRRGRLQLVLEGMVAADHSPRRSSAQVLHLAAWNSALAAPEVLRACLNPEARGEMSQRRRLYGVGWALAALLCLSALTPAWMLGADVGAAASATGLAAAAAATACLTLAVKALQDVQLLALFEALENGAGTQLEGWGEST